MLSKNTFFNLLLHSVVLIFCGVIMFVAVWLPSIETGLTLLPLICFLFITYWVNKKRETKNDD
jgi:small-conductance mechanosensitive channel